ncbi:hypothetical protein MFIFM68171_02308 [Madurella fahalii]|uniref:BTB domain-containing protein n=1 Tax=Madurella fahalii TaxID=1157608 RepID=A0ABQ0G2V3_9PEZI
MAYRQPVRVDDDGDLRLIIGPDEWEFLVCSRSLSRVSRVFKCMLYGGFRESRPVSDTESWVVKLPEDDSAAAKLLLDVIHARFDGIPTTLPLAELYNVLVFTEKYDMTKVLRPWLQAWVTSLSALHESPDISYAIGLARELGAKDTLGRLARRLIVDSGINNEGQLVDANKKLIEQPSMPLISSQLFENAARIRMNYLHEIFKSLKEIISNLQLVISTKAIRYCRKEGFRPDACHAMILGSIISGLSQLELQAVWSTEETAGLTYPLSINHLVNVIEKIHVTYMYDDHRNCNPIPVMLKEIEDLLASNEGYLTADNLAYVEKQREKLGEIVIS